MKLANEGGEGGTTAADYGLFPLGGQFMVVFLAASTVVVARLLLELLEN